MAKTMDKPKKVSKASVKKSTNPLLEHPTYQDMISKAIANLKERNGSSLPAIKKYLATEYNLPEGWDKKVLIYIKKMVDDKRLTKVKSSYKLGDSLKKKEKKNTKKAAPKTKIAKKSKGVSKPKKSPGAKKVKKAPAKKVAKKAPTKKAETTVAKVEEEKSAVVAKKPTEKKEKKAKKTTTKKSEPKKKSTAKKASKGVIKKAAPKKAPTKKAATKKAPKAKKAAKK